MAKRILILDDDPEICEVIKDSIEELKAEIEVSHDPFHAIEMMVDDRYDMAIIDVNMPRFSGTDVRDWLKSNFPETKVLVCTGDQEITIEGTEIIRKPFQANEMLEKVRSMI